MKVMVVVMMSVMVCCDCEGSEDGGVVMSLSKMINVVCVYLSVFVVLCWARAIWCIQFE